MTIEYTPLPDRAVFAVSGEDAKPFLQGLITNDINKVAEDKAIFAALLSPQGKFLYDFFIIEHQGQLLFDTDKARLPELIKRLGMYKLRSKVEFAEMPALRISAVWGVDKGTKHDAQGTIQYDDPRLPELGMRIIYDASSRGLTTGSQAKIPAFAGMTRKEINSYENHRLSLGVPDGSKDLVFDRSLPLEYGYDELHAIDFNKGCYVGQEVTARTKHRATLRKFIHTVKGAAPLPPPGALVLAGEREAGIMASSIGDIGLALLRVEEAQGVLTCGGVGLTASLPAWCNTSFTKDAK